jgi:adenosylcobinamide-GDP ribazoletransferase
MIEALKDMAAAFQFLTRLPLAWLPYRGDTLSNAAKYFPLVGLAVGAAIVGLDHLLAPHLPIGIVALLLVFFTVLLTGGMQEDGLADAADAFGGGWNREKILEIMKDSRIGSYGALAIVFTVAARILFLANLPANRFVAYVISAEVLSRWTALPLGAALDGARNEVSLGGRIARQVSYSSLAIGTLLALVPVLWLLREAAWKPVIVVLFVALCSGAYYKRRLGGITGDCFGATIQLAAIAVYCVGVWQ